jgi:hypothetical protein
VSAFVVTLHPNVTVNGVSQPNVGTVPTVNYSSPDGGVTWTLSFSGAGVTGGSIANGVYDITVNNGSVTVNSTGAVLFDPPALDTFYRLFGDSKGTDTGSVNNLTDFTRFKAALGSNVGQPAYKAYFDWNSDGTINNLVDFTHFKADLGETFGGYTKTL